MRIADRWFLVAGPGVSSCYRREPGSLESGTQKGTDFYCLDALAIFTRCELSA
jgi:hypothetical protein